MGVNLKPCQLLLVYHNGLCLAPRFFPSIVMTCMPNITEGIEGDPLLYMYADYITVYVSAPFWLPSS